MQKWYALALIVAGIASTAWAIRLEPDASLDRLPIMIIAGLGGMGAVVVGLVWLGIVIFHSA